MKALHRRVGVTFLNVTHDQLEASMSATKARASLSMSTAPELMCRINGPEVAAFKAACVEHKLWGCFSLMEFNPNGNPYNTGIVIDDRGDPDREPRVRHVGLPHGVEGDGPQGVPARWIVMYNGLRKNAVAYEPVPKSSAKRKRGRPPKVRPA